MDATHRRTGSNRDSYESKSDHDTLSQSSILEGQSRRTSTYSCSSDEQTLGLLSLDHKARSHSESTLSKWTPSMDNPALPIRHLRSAVLDGLRPGAARRNKKLSPTSYLDGMRGLAACIVVQSHASGASGLEGVWLLQQPIIRINHAGQAIVDVFFIISGFVLSYRMLKLMRSRDAPKLLDSLASSTFKRFLRLHLPVALATFISMLLIRLNMFPNPPRERLPSVFAQLWDWVCDFVWSTNPFLEVRGWWYDGIFRTQYLDQMWTVPVEFRGSMVLFSYCAACCKLSDKNRIRLSCLTLVLCYYWQAVYAAMFLGGMLIADISLGRQEAESSLLIGADPEKGGQKPRQSVLARIGWSLLFLFAIFCLSQPHPLLETSPFPWNYTRRLVPYWWVHGDDYDGKEHFLYGIGAFSLLLSAESYPALQTPFNSKFAQYLGEISFGMYAMHNMIIWIIADPILGPWRQQHFGDMQLGFLVVVIPVFLLTFWLGDCFTRLNRHVVNIGVKVQKRLFTE